jgi:hypothetical protein
MIILKYQHSLHIKAGFFFSQNAFEIMKRRNFNKIVSELLKLYRLIKKIIFFPALIQGTSKLIFLPDIAFKTGLSNKEKTYAVWGK